jgi:acyl-CoA ligase (AMP-forming) (exosortase A-associated)
LTHVNEVLMRIQLHHLVAEAAARAPAAPALTSRGVTLSYDELWQRVAAVGAGLRTLGLGRGDRVAVYLDKRVETVPAIFGTSVAGGVFVPVNPLLKARQVAYLLSDCDARVLITTADRLAQLRPELDSCKALEHVILVDTPGWADLMEGTREPIDGAGVDSARIDSAGIDGAGVDADVAAIFYTSGSTGRPKGVVLSHRNLIVGAESVSHYLGNNPDDVILAALPLSFDAGFSQLTTGFHAGAQVVLHNHMLPADLVRLCAKHQVTGLTGVPPLWLQLIDAAWPDEATRHLRYFANTGGRMPRATLDRLRVLFPAARPFLMYGLTEAFRSTYLDPAEVDRRPDSIGKAIPNAEILVVRPDGTLCDPGEPGELVHRGALVALGYWNDPQHTAERFRPIPGRAIPEVAVPELAVFSGDLVVRDAEGFLYFVSRQDEMIKTSGYRVSPTEVEEALYDTGLVRDAVALGIDDPRLGQRIVVVVSPAAGSSISEAYLLAALRERLPLYMVPKQIVVRAELARSPNGKFDRAALRQELS